MTLAQIQLCAFKIRTQPVNWTNKSAVSNSIWVKLVVRIYKRRICYELIMIKIEETLKRKLLISFN